MTALRLPASTSNSSTSRCGADDQLPVISTTWTPYSQSLSSIVSNGRLQSLSVQKESFKVVLWGKFERGFALVCSKGGKKRQWRPSPVFTKARLLRRSASMSGLACTDAAKGSNDAGPPYP